MIDFKKVYENDTGLRATETVALYGGYHDEVCTEDYTDWLEQRLEEAWAEIREHKHGML